MRHSGKTWAAKIMMCRSSSSNQKPGHSPIVYSRGRKQSEIVN